MTEEPTPHEVTEAQKTGARRTAIILCVLVFSMIAVATLSRIYGW